MNGLESTLELLAFGCNFFLFGNDTHIHPRFTPTRARCSVSFVVIFMPPHVQLKLSDNPISWIDERDDTELGVIADFLETIVDVPVSPRNMIGLIYSRACRCRT